MDRIFAKLGLCWGADSFDGDRDCDVSCLCVVKRDDC